MVQANSINNEMSVASNYLPTVNDSTSAVANKSTFPIELKKIDSDALYFYPTTQLVFTDCFLTGPLQVRGSALAFGDGVWVDFVDSTGLHLITLSVQTVLYLIDHFIERDRISLLTQAALHYGLGANALMGADLDGMRDTPQGDTRHEGPLTLPHHSLGVTTFTGIAVRSHAGRCGMTLEEVLWRFDQFGTADQAELMAGLAKHFDLGQEETAGAA